MTANKLHNRLPYYKAPNNAWEVIVQALDSLESKSKKAIPMNSQLCPEAIWGNISSQLDDLDTDNIRTQIADKLPEYTTEININEIQKETIKYQWLKIAAAIVLLIGISGTLLTKLSQPKETISYSIVEVMIEENDFIMSEALPSIGFEEILQQFCSQKPQVCQNQDYKQLNTQLEQIKAEEQNLSELQKQHKDPQLQKMLIQLKNDKIQIEKTLITLF